jgi:hypothetical protein
MRLYLMISIDDKKNVPRYFIVFIRTVTEVRVVNKLPFHMH